MNKKAYWIAAIILIIVLFYGYKKGWFSSSASTGSVDMATSCYKQLLAFVNNNPTMTGADIKNNFVSNADCSKL